MLCLHKIPFLFQQFIILPSYHVDYVVKIPPYFNFPIKCVNRMVLVLNVHKRQQVPPQFRKIDNIMQKKIRESKQFEFDGVDTSGFEIGSIYKLY